MKYAVFNKFSLILNPVKIKFGKSVSPNKPAGIFLHFFGDNTCHYSPQQPLLLSATLTSDKKSSRSYHCPLSMIFSVDWQPSGRCSFLLRFAFLCLVLLLIYSDKDIFNLLVFHQRPYLVKAEPTDFMKCPHFGLKCTEIHLKCTKMHALELICLA